MDKNQASRWNEQELQLIKDVFKNREFVYKVRDVIMGFSDSFDFETTDEAMAILAKNLLPSFSQDVPMEMQQDLCSLSLGFIEGFNAEQAILRIKAFDIAEDYLKRRFDVLCGKKDDGESLNDLKDKEKAKNDEERFVRMLAYMQLGSYADKSLNQLLLVAEHKELTTEELEKRKQMNSSK